MLKADDKNSVKSLISIEVEFHLGEGSWFFNTWSCTGAFSFLPATKYSQEKTFDVEGGKKLLVIQKGWRKYWWAIWPLFSQSGQIYSSDPEIRVLQSWWLNVCSRTAAPARVLRFSSQRRTRSVRKGGRRTLAVRVGGAISCLSARAGKAIGQSGRAGKKPLVSQEGQGELLSVRKGGKSSLSVSQSGRAGKPWLWFLQKCSAFSFCPYGLTSDHEIQIQHTEQPFLISLVISFASF